MLVPPFTAVAHLGMAGMARAMGATVTGAQKLLCKN